MRTVKKEKQEEMTTIQVRKSTAKFLQSYWTKFGDTYDAVIRRHFDGGKLEGGPHGGLKDESTGDGDH